MRVIIFGASGGTGQLLVEQALAQGHHVTAFLHHSTTLAIEHSCLTIVKGDVLDLTDVEDGVAGQDGVCCVLGVKPTTVQPVCSMGTKHIIAAMQKQGVKHLICQSSAMVAALNGEKWNGSWISPVALSLFPRVQAMFADKVLQEQFIYQSNLDWVIVRPATLIDGPRTGIYTVGDALRMSLFSKIARADVADFLLKQLNDETYVHKVPCIRY